MRSHCTPVCNKKAWCQYQAFIGYIKRLITFGQPFSLCCHCNPLWSSDCCPIHPAAGWIGITLPRQLREALHLLLDFLCPSSPLPSPSPSPSPRPSPMARGALFVGHSDCMSWQLVSGVTMLLGQWSRRSTFFNIEISLVSFPRFIWNSSPLRICINYTVMVHIRVSIGADCCVAETEGVMCSLLCLICPVAPVVPVALPLSECPILHLSAALFALHPVSMRHTRAGPVASSHSKARFGQANLCCPSAPHQTRLPLSQAACCGVPAGPWLWHSPSPSANTEGP